MPVIDLDDERADQVALVGAKAARLAQARRLGLPVLPGVVVPANEAGPAMARASAALAAGGAGRARLAITRAKLDAELCDALHAAARRLAGDRFIVRSSSREESSAVWGGAFASYPDVSPGEIGPAVRACWASAFTSHVLELCEAVGVPPGHLSLAVLIQPHLRAEAGGTATVHVGSAVTVIGARGSAAGLLSGLNRAECVRVDVDGTMNRAVGGLEASAVRLVAELARRALALTGHGQLEWALSRGRPVILQLQPVVPAEPLSSHRANPLLASATALRIARLVQRFRGPTGESLVLPWALGTRNLDWGAPDPLPPSGSGTRWDPRRALERARLLANRLTAASWRLAPDQAQQQAERTIRQLRGADPGPALAAVDQLAAPDRRDMRELRSLLRTLGQQLLGAGRIHDERELWGMDADSLQAVVAGGRATTAGRPPRPDGWDAFLFGAVSGAGSARWGTAASPGTATGALCPLRGTSDARGFPTGGIMLVTHPTAPLAPLLWRAAGLVAWAGSPAAHLVEVARALGVPAVVSCPVEDEAGCLAAIDGSAGVVWSDKAEL